MGDVLFERSKRAKHLNITIRPFQGIRVAIPKGVEIEEAESLVLRKISWISKHSARMKDFEQGRIVEDDKVIERRRADAKKVLIPRLNYLAKKHNLPYNKVTIRNQKTRWGSCSQKNNINLNMKLITLPEEIIDYVLIHELVHTKIKNHSKKYWDELKILVPNTKYYIKQLKEYHIGL